MYVYLYICMFQILEDEENETPAMKQNPERWGRE